MFPTEPNVASANESVLGFGLNADQVAPYSGPPKGVTFAESTATVALENMFMRRLVPDTNCNAPTGGVKAAVYKALPFVMRMLPMNPV